MKIENNFEIGELSIAGAKTIDSSMLSVIGLFIPAPICSYGYLFKLWGYGFGYTICFGKYIPLGWVMITVALIF